MALQLSYEALSAVWRQLNLHMLPVLTRCLSINQSMDQSKHLWKRLMALQVGSEGRAAMWRQLNLHTLPVLTRCLEDVAAAREVSPGTLDAVVLVSKVCDFFWILLNSNPFIFPFMLAPFLWSLEDVAAAREVSPDTLNAVVLVSLKVMSPCRNFVQTSDYEI